MTPTEKKRDSYLRRTYGITLDDYRKILHQQNELCPVCTRSFSATGGTPCVDHSHRSPRYIRGLLCRFCNHRVVGRHTDPELLRRASEYLEGPFTGFIVPDKKRKKRGKTKRLSKT